MERRPIGWVESPLQLLGAAEWASARGTALDIVCRLTTQIPETAAEIGSRRAPVGEMLPYVGIPWARLAASPHWVVGDGFSGQFRLAASILRPRRVTLLDDGANTVALADVLIGERSYARPGVRESSISRRTGAGALRHLRAVVEAGGVDLFTAFALGDARQGALLRAGYAVERHGFSWLRSTRRSGHLRRVVPGDRVMLGSARPVDGRIAFADYLAWVAQEAAADPVVYLPHRREPEEQLEAVAELRGVRVARPNLPVELVLGGVDRPLEVLTLPSSATTTLRLLLRGTGSVVREVGPDAPPPGPGARAAEADPVVIGAGPLGIVADRAASLGAHDDLPADGEGQTDARGRGFGPDVVAVIPARGGSVGVRRKNLRLVGGVPLVGRAVLAALGSGIERVYVSTDDADIAIAARRHGAEVIDRPADLAGSTASSESALLHAIDELSVGGRAPRVLAFLQATSPFIDTAALRAAVERVGGRNADSVFSAVETFGFLWERDDEAGARAVNHVMGHRPRRQDREPHFLETGAFYVLDVAGFRRAGHRFFGRVECVEVPERTAIEIDTEEQLDVARALCPLVERDTTPLRRARVVGA